MARRRARMPAQGEVISEQRALQLRSAGRIEIHHDGIKTRHTAVAKCRQIPGAFVIHMEDCGGGGQYAVATIRTTPTPQPTPQTTRAHREDKPTPALAGGLFTGGGLR